MKPSRSFIACAAMLIWMFSLPIPAQGQVREWDFSVSAFGGGALPFTTDVKRSGSGLGVPFSFAGKGLELNSSVSFGGKITDWWLGLRHGSNLDFGAELDISQSYPNLKAQTASMTGSNGGLPVSGLSVPFPRVAISSTILAINALLRWPLGVTPELPNSRWYPYIGWGGGADIAHAKSLDLEQTDAVPAWQALGGVQFFLTRHLAAFAEYKFTQAGHTYKFSWEYEKETANVNHLVAEPSWHF